MKDEREFRQSIHSAVDADAAAARENPCLARRVIARANGKEQPVMKKKLSIAAIVMIALLLAGLTATAIGLTVKDMWKQSFEKMNTKGHIQTISDEAEAEIPMEEAIAIARAAIIAKYGTPENELDAMGVYPGYFARGWDGEVYDYPSEWDVFFSSRTDVDLDEDHEPFFALMNQTYLDILDKIIAINAGPDGYYRNAPSHNDALYMTEYASGNTLFYATILSGVNSTRDYNFSTGYLPAPKYNEDQKEYYSISIGGNISVLPRNLQADRMDYVGILLEVLSYESRNTSVAEYRDTYLKTKLADENDAEMIQLLFDTVTYDLGNNLFAKKGRLEVNKNVFHELNRQYTSALEVIETDVENQIEEYLELIAKIIDAQ